MKKKQIKQEINNVLNEETPNFLAEIKSKCENIVQVEPIFFEERKKLSLRTIFPKMIYIMIAFILFIAGIALGNLKMDKTFKEASIFLDVNPSIEIQVSNNNMVIEALSVNEDGTKILNNMSLKGVHIDTALYAIIGAMYTNGYLNNQNNSILVSVESDNEELIILDDISKVINDIFSDNEEMSCSIIAQKFKSSNDLKEKAKEYNVSIGKMQLIEKIINKCDIYTEENVDDLVNMSIHELDFVYQSIKTSDEDNDIITGKPNGFIENNNVLEYLLNAVEINQEILRHQCVVLYQKEGNAHKMIYLITLDLANKERVKYIIDCTTGEIMPEETLNDWKDKLPNEGHFGGPNAGPNDNPRN